jgi:ribose transport system permease protein
MSTSSAPPTPRAVRGALTRSYARRNAALLLPYIGALGVLVIGAVAVDDFASSRSLTSILTQAAILAVVAAAQTFVILGGGIDLSVPWVITGAGVFTALLADSANGPLVWAIPCVLAMAAVVGLANGIGVALIGIPPIIMTLAMNGVLSGLVVIYGSRAESHSAAPPLLRDAVSGHVAGIPAYVVVVVVVIAAFSLLLSFTRFGRYLYAVGTSVRVSRLSGVAVHGIVITSYVFSSVTAALGGMLLFGYVNNAYFGMGDRYLFTSVVAVIIGGASILGGSGHYLGTVGGALLLSVAQALLIVLDLGQGSIDVFYGLIILASVVVLSGRTRGWAQTVAGRRRRPDLT